MTSATSPQTSLPRWQRLLAPAELLEGRSAARAARDWPVDTILAMLAAGIGAFTLAETWSAHSGAGLALDLAIGGLAWLALWARRSRPTGVALFALLASFVSAAAGGPGLVAAFSAVVRASRRGVAAVIAASAVGAAAFPAIYPSGSPYLVDVTVGVLLTAVVIGWGLFARARRQLVLSVRDRAERLEAEQRLTVAQAREAERRRIANEMHDVLAHRVSLLSVHAGALEFRPDAPAPEIARAAAVIRASAHGVLQELREVIGVLRVEGDAAVSPPQPTLAELPALANEARAAGARVDLRIVLPEGAPPPPALLGRTAYRVVQEGLTNARKHAPAAAVTAAVEGRPGAALVASVVSRPPIGAAPTPMPGWGVGLIGLRERVTLAGGELEHGPDADGDFVLRATLPWPPV